MSGQALKVRLASMRSWDGADVATIERLSAFIDANALPSRPLVTLDSDGQAVGEFHMGDVFADVTFHADGQASAYRRDGDNPSSYKSGELSDAEIIAVISARS